MAILNIKDSYDNFIKIFLKYTIEVKDLFNLLLADILSRLYKMVVHFIITDGAVAFKHLLFPTIISFISFDCSNDSLPCRSGGW